MDMALTLDDYVLIAKLENKYGSLSKVKNDDPDFKKLRIEVTGKFEEYSERVVVRALNRGHSDKWAMDRYNISKSTLIMLRNKYLIRKVPIFRFRTSNGIYATSYLSLKKYTKINTKLFSKLKSLGITVMRKDYIWDDIPVNGYYLSHNGKLHIKHDVSLSDYERT